MIDHAEGYDLICAERIIKNSYVLLFSWSCGNEVVQAAKKVAKELRLQLISLTPPPRTMGSGIKRKLDVGPREFLSMIKYAEFIVTDSFHGTAFATTFEKNYVSIVSSGGADTRMVSLLQQLGLENHLVDAEHIQIEEMKKTDYKSVRAKKMLLRRSSLEFLEKAFAGLQKGEKVRGTWLFHHEDDAVKMRSSSGGACYELSNAMLGFGGYFRDVFGIMI